MLNKKIKNDEKPGFFERGIHKISDWFYDLKVMINQKKKPRFENIKISKYRKVIFYSAFMFLPLLQLFIFYFMVNANSILLAFQRFNVVTNKFEWAGFANFRELFHNIAKPGDPLRIGLKNSLIIFACNTLIGVTLALLFSYYIYKKRSGAGIFRVILFLPAIISTVIMVLMYKYFTDRAIPALIEKIFHVKVSGILSNPNTRFAAIVIFGIWSGFGANVLMYTSAMTGIPEEVIEAGKLDGISPAREFFQLVIPLIYPTITAFFIINMTGIFISQGAIYEFYGKALPDGNLYTIGYYLFVHVLNSTGMNNYAYASTAGIVATFIAAPLTLCGKALLERFDPSREAV